MTAGQPRPSTHSTAIAAGPRHPQPAGAVPTPRVYEAGVARRYRQMTDEQLLAHCRTHPAGTVRAEAAQIEALLHGARIRLAVLRQNLPSVDEARQLREAQQRRRSDRR